MIGVTIYHRHATPRSASNLGSGTAEWYLNSVGDVATSSAVAEPPVSGLHRVSLPETPEFEEVYAKYFPLAWRTARRLGVAESALDDVCQEIFLAVHRRLPQYAGESSVRTWIFGFILNVVQVHHRHQRRKSPYHRATGELVDLDTLVDLDRTPADDTVHIGEAVSIARQALRKMDETKRLPFLMAELEGFSASEISAALGLNVNTVHSRIRSARREFRRRVKKQGSDDGRANTARRR